MWFYFLWPHLHPFWNQRMGKILLTNTINKDNRNSLRYRRYPLLSLRRVQKSVRKARDVRSPSKGTLPQPVSRPEWWPIKRRITPLLLMQARHVKRPTDDPSQGILHHIEYFLLRYHRRKISVFIQTEIAWKLCPLSQ